MRMATEIALRRICVFCGSSPGARPEYAAAARELARHLAAAGIGLVYGGGRVGLMGVLADGVLAGDGHVIGVIPESLMGLEVEHRGLPDLRIVATMHERKALMSDLADAFIALPGGLGTLDESFEVLTWAQLGLHAKPFGLLNIGGYFDRLLEFLDHSVDERFVRPEHRDLLIVESTVAALLHKLKTYQPQGLEKWIDRGDV